MEFGTFLFLGFLLVIALLELAFLKKQGRTLPWQEFAANFGVAIGKRLVDIATYGAAAAVLFFAYQFRIWDLQITNWIDGAVFFLLFEFAYYWHHRWAHEVRWMWATHSVHHSPEHMNLSVSGRLGWTGLLSGSVLVFVPLALLGYNPLLIGVTLAMSLFYQVFLHTELVGKLGPLEWILNTPSHHRAHHGSNPEYIDKNYGGVLIIFDRLFGTFEEENAKVKYGLTKSINTCNPVKIAFYEWINIARDVKSANSVKHALGYMFARPGWQPKTEKTKLVSAKP